LDLQLLMRRQVERSPEPARRTTSQPLQRRDQPATRGSELRMGQGAEVERWAVATGRLALGGRQEDEHRPRLVTERGQGFIGL
ncbi:MAG: hypothetical protein JWO88_3324, partial [Frankiales bacterium]|nr:hypothetical protein [Frankiales bacterium]